MYDARTLSWHACELGGLHRRACELTTKELPDDDICVAVLEIGRHHCRDAFHAGLRHAIVWASTPVTTCVTLLE